MRGAMIDDWGPDLAPHELRGCRAAALLWLVGLATVAAGVGAWLVV